MRFLLRFKDYYCLLDEFFFLLGIVEAAQEGIEVVVLPILVGSLSPLDLLICLQLILMILEIPASDDVIISEPSGCHFLHFLFLLLLGNRSLIWCSIVMLCQRHIRQDVVLSIGLGALAEVPGLLLGVIRAILESLEFVLKVDNIVGLLVP